MAMASRRQSNKFRNGRASGSTTKASMKRAVTLRITAGLILMRFTRRCATKKLGGEINMKLLIFIVLVFVIGTGIVLAFFRGGKEDDDE